MFVPVLAVVAHPNMNLAVDESLVELETCFPGYLYEPVIVFECVFCICWKETEEVAARLEDAEQIYCELNM